jgi:N-acetylneuraminic acid mutarotase
METARSEMPLVELDGKIYALGGLGAGDSVEVYEIASDTWSAAANMPAGRHHMMAAAHGGRLYAFGGYGTFFQANDNAWVYDPQTDSWSDIAELPNPIGAGFAVTLGDYIHIIGGVPDGTQVLRYDPAANSYTQLASMHAQREHVAAVVFEGKIYVLAGRWSGLGELASAEVYDPVTDAWELLPPMNATHSGHAAVVYDGQILVMGGERLTTGETLDIIEAYDPATNTWSLFDPLPRPLHGVPAIVAGGELYVIGGSTVAGAAQNIPDVYRYIP